MFRVTFTRLGESDCESLSAGFLAQPVNALSSLAFSVIGVAVIWWSLRVEGHERAVRVVFGSLMVLTGIGSFLFHGPQGPGSQFGHDITFLVTVLFVAVVNVAETYGWKRSVAWGALGAGSLALAASLLVAPWLTNVLMVLDVAALISSDVALRRRHGPRTSWYVASLVATVAAVSMFLVGRTSSALCDPASLFQGHALWHLFAAVALGGYFVATSESRTSRESRAST